MRVGSGDGELSHSVARVHAARETLGPDIDIMCDAHGTFSVVEAKRFCRQVADCDIAWLEEPVTADDKRGQAEVRACTDIPISAGESERSEEHTSELQSLMRSSYAVFCL